MRTTTLLLVLLASTPALAKSWQGIDPGTSKRAQIVEKFGEPSRTATSDGKEVLAYFEKSAIKGTKQVQFRVDPGTQVVERIDVFPSVAVDRDMVENTYGPPCPSGKETKAVCYVKKMTEDFRTYLDYQRVGLAVFFHEDGKLVNSFTYTAPQGAK